MSLVELSEPFIFSTACFDTFVGDRMVVAHLFIVLQELGPVFKGSHSSVAQVAGESALPDQLISVDSHQKPTSHVSEQDQLLSERGLHEIEKLISLVSPRELCLHAVVARAEFHHKN